MFYKDEKLGLFIDGLNIHSSARALGMDMDFKLLRKEFLTRGKLLRAMYYTSLLEGEEYSPVRPLIDWLDYNGFSMVTKQAREYTDSAGRKKIKGSMTAEMVVDMLEMAPHLDHMVLFSGDGDFCCAVDAVQKKGVRVSVVSTIKSSPPMISDELRRKADNFIDLDDLRDVVGRSK
ncbi:MAG: NYN domain-containing protein [Roseibium sp.]|uniref:LabA-like NYN domain-containing protein n=1 Tax=Roseibium sp. TaxID=1936156 RepID=UPI00329A161D